MDNEHCHIWAEFGATVEMGPDATNRITSSRMGGAYEINSIGRIWSSLSDSDLDDRIRARLTTLVMNQRFKGIQIPEITLALLEEAKQNSNLLPYERANRLLRYLVQMSESVEISIFISKEVRKGFKNYAQALAWSESVNWPELIFLLQYLEQQGWVQKLRFENQLCRVRVSVDGYRQTEQLSIKQESSQCFVAMWFDDEMDKCYQEGIRPAIEAAGYTSMRIDEKHHANKIDDEIIAEIRRSVFLVADFTYGSKGVRGGVYYEAGFAYGLNLPVIFTCRDDQLDDLHFDTRQYNHISWKMDALDIFRQDLRNRILAVIGEGPNRP